MTRATDVSIHCPPSSQRRVIERRENAVERPGISRQRNDPFHGIHGRVVETVKDGAAAPEHPRDRSDPYFHRSTATSGSVAGASRFLPFGSPIEPRDSVDAIEFATRHRQSSTDSRDYRHHFSIEQTLDNKQSSSVEETRRLLPASPRLASPRCVGSKFRYGSFLPTSRALSFVARAARSPIERHQFSTILSGGVSSTRTYIPIAGDARNDASAAWNHRPRRTGVTPKTINSPVRSWTWLLFCVYVTREQRYTTFYNKGVECISATL